MEQVLKKWKKRTLLILYFMFIAGVLGVFAQVNLKEGLVAYYPFDNGTEDASGNGNDGENHKANRERDVNGTKNGSYRFSNDKDRITIPVDINAGSMPQMAMCAWVYPFNRWDEITVISNDDGGGDRKIYTVKQGKKYVWAISNGKGKAIGKVPVEHREWVFLVANYDEKSGYASIYVDGQKTLGKTSMDMGSAMTMIGSNTHDNEDFEAIIDEVRIYNRLLDSEEIDSLMALKNPKRLHEKAGEKNYYYLPEQDNLIVRSAPTRDSRNIGKVDKTDTLRFSEEVPTKGGKWNEWLKVKLDGKTGYISLKYLEHRAEEDDEMSAIEAYLDEKMDWGSWQYWAIMGGALLLGILGVVFFSSLDGGLGRMTGSDYVGMAYFPIVTALAAVLMALIIVFWQDSMEYYFADNFTLWPYGYGFGTWAAWFVMMITALTFLIMVLESLFSTNPIHGFLRIIIQTLLAALMFIPVMIITMALVVVMLVLFFIGILLSGIGGYRYVVYRY
jgi:hypothetical protein